MDIEKEYSIKNEEIKNLAISFNYAAKKCLEEIVLPNGIQYLPVPAINSCLFLPLSISLFRLNCLLNQY